MAVPAVEACIARRDDRSRLRDLWFIVAAAYLTNVGNGIFSVALGKYIYDWTGQVSAFGLAWVAEYSLITLASLVAGPLTDRSNPKRLSVTLDMSRLVLFAAFYALFAATGSALFLFAPFVANNLARPFNRCAIFALQTEVCPRRHLESHGSRCFFAMQAGFLSGTAAFPAFVAHFSIEQVWLFNGISYGLSGLVLSRIAHPFERRGILPSWRSLGARALVADWKAIADRLRADAHVLVGLVLLAFEVLILGLTTAIQAPLVARHLGGDSMWFAALGVSFLAGILGAVLALRRARAGTRQARVALHMALCGVAVALVGVNTQLELGRHLYAFLFAVAGFTNTMVMASLVAAVQRRLVGEIKGRIATVRNFIASLATVALMLPITFCLDSSMLVGLAVAGGVCLSYAAAYLAWSCRMRAADQAGRAARRRADVRLT